MSLPFGARTFTEARDISRAQVLHGSSVLALLNRQYTRDKDGKFSSTGGVRDSLAGAKTIDDLNAAAMSEARRITGRDIPFDMTGSDLGIAKDHVEGIMQGLERFPDATLVGVHTYGPGAASTGFRTEVDRLHPDASAVTQAHGVMEGGRLVVKSNVYFNTRNSEDPAAYRTMRETGHREGYLATGTPTGTALHEFGHVVTNQTGVKAAAYDRAVEMADAAGVIPRTHISRQVSKYAASDMGEFAAEAFADVMTNGAGASEVSRAAFDVIESAYKEGT
ncbi:MAG: hypothetical protein ACM30G_06990 [Micromonosporaceae bacterium]